MADTVTDIISARAREPEGLSGLIAWSAAAHVVCLAALLFVPAPHADEEPDVVISISWAGAEGPRSGGQTAMGGRTIAAPPPDAPEPVRQVEAPPPPPQAPAMTLPAPDPPRRRPPQERAPRESPRRPQQAQAAPREPSQTTPRRTPFSAEQPRDGSTPVETGARGRAQGLSTGGGGGTPGMELDVRSFCDLEYLQRMRAIIERNWNSDHNVTGSSKIGFTIHRDGRIEPIAVSASSGHEALDQSAWRAVYLASPLPPLPICFPNPTLTVGLTFEY